MTGPYKQRIIIEANNVTGGFSFLLQPDVPADVQTCSSLRKNSFLLLLLLCGFLSVRLMI